MRYFFVLFFILSIAQADEKNPFFLPPQSDSELNELMTSRTAVLRSEVQKQWELSFSTNFQMGEGIQIYDCDEFPGGPKVFLQTIYSAFEKGFQCLGRFAEINANRKADVIALKSILSGESFNNQKISFVCTNSDSVEIAHYSELPATVEDGWPTSWKFGPHGVSYQQYALAAKATATSLSFPQWPALALNLISLHRAQQDHLVFNTEKTIFHESWHWLGYQHKSFFSSEHDLIEDIAECCFEADKIACDALRANIHDASPYAPRQK